MKSRQGFDSKEKCLNVRKRKRLTDFITTWHSKFIFDNFKAVEKTEREGRGTEWSPLPP